MPFETTRPTASPSVSAPGAAASKAAPIAAMSCPSSKSSPVMLIFVYLNIQPMTTLYPIARPMEPMTGRMPMPSPTRRLMPRSAAALPKEPTRPAPPQRPSANSSMTPEQAIITTNRKYGSRKVQPAVLAHQVGEAPDVRHADGRAYAGNHEAELA